MKRNFIIMVLLIATTFSVYSQRENKQKYKEANSKFNRVNKHYTMPSFDSSTDEEPLPYWVLDMNNLSKKELKNYAKRLNIPFKDFDANYLIKMTSSIKDSELSEVKSYSSVSDVFELAWQRSRKRFVESFIEEFSFTSTVGGSTAIDKTSLRESMYAYLSRPNSVGISPLTVLKQYIVRDKNVTAPGYNCYMLVCVRKKEFEVRYKKLLAELSAEKNADSNAALRFEEFYAKWRENYN